jgi:hypothetical protein
MKASRFVWIGTRLGLLLIAASSFAQTYHFTAIDVPCSGCPGGIARLTNPQGIDPGGAIVGTYKDEANAQHGFLLRDGNFTRLDFPGAVATVAKGIGPGGVIVGDYTAPVGSPNCAAPGAQCIRGFRLERGNYETVLFPGHPGAIPQRIAPDGTIYGCLHDFDTMGSMYGAVWSRFGPSSLMPGGGELADGNQSLDASMNNGATPDGSMVVGIFMDMMTNLWHGFIVQNGDLQTYDVPGSTFTNTWDINPSRVFVGAYVDSNGKQHGFIQPPGDVPPITIDYPGAAATSVFGINPAGAIVGTYTMNGKTRGFLAVPD